MGVRDDNRMHCTNPDMDGCWWKGRLWITQLSSNNSNNNMQCVWGHIQHVRVIPEPTPDVRQTSRSIGHVLSRLHYIIGDVDGEKKQS